MAFERNSNDPNKTIPSNDELLRRRAAQLDNELQADPELAEGPAGGGRIALFAIALALILGAVFYGLNDSSLTSTKGTPTAQTTPINPAPGNTAQPGSPATGQTTGSATTPQQPATGQPSSPPTQLSPPPSPPAANRAPSSDTPSK